MQYPIFFHDGRANWEIVEIRDSNHIKLVLKGCGYPQIYDINQLADCMIKALETIGVIVDGAFPARFYKE